MNELIPFDFEGKSCRVAVLDGEPWWIGKDVCESLGYTNPSKAMGDHCKGITKRYPLPTAGGMQEFRVINEPDVLRLIVGSTLPAAERFERWVFEEVLPSLRKTGTYALTDATAKLQAQAALIERAGGVEAILQTAAKGLIQDLFTNNPNVTSQEVNHLVELSLARSEATGEYLTARDVSRIVIGGGESGGMCAGTIENKVRSIRAIAACYGTPKMTRAENGKYVSLPAREEGRI
jgi:Prophage antirepressor